MTQDTDYTGEGSPSQNPSGYSSSPLCLSTEDLDRQPTQRKCCGKCAYRSGSQERSDVWQLIAMQEAGQAGQPFFCHEIVPKHSQYVDDGTQSFRLCAGYNTHRRTKFENLLRLNQSSLCAPSREIKP